MRPNPSGRCLSHLGCSSQNLLTQPNPGAGVAREHGFDIEPHGTKTGPAIPAGEPRRRWHGDRDKSCAMVTGNSAHSTQRPLIGTWPGVDRCATQVEQATSYSHPAAALSKIKRRTPKARQPRELGTNTYKKVSRS